MMFLTSTPPASRTASAARGRRAGGTTLVEVLVVIVIFMVGILAVVQIFPKGFQVLSLARRNAQSSALARDAAERLRAMNDGVPEQIVALDATTGNVMDIEPGFFGLRQGDIQPNGDVLVGATNIGNWGLHFGPNLFRGIIGESHRITAPRRVGASVDSYGSLVIPTFAPIDTNMPIRVRGNFLAREGVLPEDLTVRGVTNLYDTRANLGDFVFLYNNATDAFSVPTGNIARSYAFDVTVLVNHQGQLIRRTFRNVPLTVPAATVSPVTGNFPLAAYTVATQLTALLAPGDTIGSILPGTFRVARNFVPVATFSQDPFEYRVIDASKGLFLFNPLGFDAFATVNGQRVPLQCQFDYSVSDWRVLRSEVRLTDSDNGQVQLPLGSLKINNEQGPDGLPSPGIGMFEPTGNTQARSADHFAVIDLETGGIVYERDPGSETTLYLTVDKSLGVVRFEDIDNSQPGIQVLLRLPDGTDRPVDLAGRALRMLYMAKDEWAVQILKPAGVFSQTTVAPRPDEFYIGGTDSAMGGLPTRIYFSAGQTGQRVSIDEVVYGDATVQSRAMGITALVRAPGDSVGLPFIDLVDYIPGIISLDFAAAPPVKGVRGASLTVRSSFNPDHFTLGPSPAANLAAMERWGRGKRVTTVQTFLQPEVAP